MWESPVEDKFLQFSTRGGDREANATRKMHLICDNARNCHT